MFLRGEPPQRAGSNRSRTDVCGVSITDLAPPAVGHAAVCLAQRSSPSLENHVKRDVMGSLVE